MKAPAGLGKFDSFIYYIGAIVVALIASALAYVLMAALRLPFIHQTPGTITKVERKQHQDVLNPELISLSMMAAGVYDDPEARVYSQGAQLTGYKYFDSNWAGGGFSAVIYERPELKQDPNKRLFVTFVGTQSTWHLITDYFLALGFVPAIFDSTLSYCKAIVKKFPHHKITVVGHSLGGGLANYCAAKLPQEINSVSFNPAAFSDRMLRGIDLVAVSKHNAVTNIVSTTDYVSQFGQMIGRTFYFDILDEEANILDRDKFAPLTGHSIINTVSSIAVAIANGRVPFYRHGEN